jgi:hypothetical protein
MIKRIIGQSQRSAIHHHLLVDDYNIEHPKDIANTFASTISFHSSHEHDMEKAYDTTWKYDVLKTYKMLDLRGRLLMFVSNFLSNRKFNVRVAP